MFDFFKEKRLMKIFFSCVVHPDSKSDNMNLKMRNSFVLTADKSLKPEYFLNSVYLEADHTKGKFSIYKTH